MLRPRPVEDLGFWQSAPVTALAPVLVLLACAPALYWFFRKTWKELDEEASRTPVPTGRLALEPTVCLGIVAVVLTLLEYYGGRSTYVTSVEPLLRKLEDSGEEWIHLKRYNDLYGYAYWSLARIIGYIAIPVVVFQFLFPERSLLDMGLRTRGFLSHLWIYGLSLVVVLLAMAVVAREGEFVKYYPFYKLSSRSWFDFLVWEALYFAQFLALEFFFRGFMLAALRDRMGSLAIFVMAVPYCMIHYGKPYMEAHAAVLAGVFLGSLAMRTKSIYAGFLVHITVAFSMDFLALSVRGALPKVFFP